MIKNKKKGFTIVELVIVIAVIGILSAVLIPVFSNVVKSAQDARQQYELSQAYTDYVQHVDVEELLSQDEVYLVKGEGESLEVWVRASVDEKDAWKDGKAEYEDLDPAASEAAGLPANFETYNGYKVYERA